MNNWQIFSFILFAISGTILIFASLLMFRNDWVYRTRIKILYEDMRTYRRLPEYTEMVWRFWIWDVRKFVAPNDPGRDG